MIDELDAKLEKFYVSYEPKKAGCCTSDTRNINHLTEDITHICEDAEEASKILANVWEQTKDLDILKLNEDTIKSLENTKASLDLKIFSDVETLEKHK